VTSRNRYGECAVSKVIRNNRAVRHIHVKRNFVFYASGARRVNFPDYTIECLGKIYRPSHGSGVWSIRYSEEMDRFCDDVTLSVFLRLKGTGHTINTTDSRIPKKSSWEDVPAEVGA
jgi:hypothetical protein